MPLMEEHCAALAERMIDDELIWLARRLPSDEEQTPFHRAVRKEAEKRFPEIRAQL